MRVKCIAWVRSLHACKAGGGGEGGTGRGSSPSQLALKVPWLSFAAAVALIERERSTATLERFGTPVFVSTH